MEGSINSLLFQFHPWNEVPDRLWISTDTVVISKLREPWIKGSCDFNNLGADRDNRDKTRREKELGTESEK